MDSPVSSRPSRLAPASSSIIRLDSDGGRPPFSFNGRYLYLTYSQPPVVDKVDFERRFSALLPQGASYFGGRELREDGGLYYHVVVSLGERVHWKDARKILGVGGDGGGSFHIDKLAKGQSVRQFLEDRQACCDRAGDTFGSRISTKSEALKRKKRKSEEVGLQPARKAKLGVAKSGTLNESETPSNSFRMPSYIDKEFRIPAAVLAWEKRYLVRPAGGRLKSLLIVGDTRKGKSRMAQFIASRNGAFSEFDTEWNLDEYRDGQRCAVFHDMKPGFKYWKEILGCQESFVAGGRYRAKRCLKWGVPSIWVCGKDIDPRRWRGGAAFIHDNCIVVEVADKLY